MQSKAANQPLTIETGQALANTGRWETRQELPVDTFILQRNIWIYKCI